MEKVGQKKYYKIPSLPKFQHRKVRKRDVMKKKPAILYLEPMNDAQTWNQKDWRMGSGVGLSSKQGEQRRFCQSNIFSVGNTMGNPGVRHANLDPYPSDPYPLPSRVYPSK